MSGRTILVTGGAGFIGSHLVDALVDAGDRVTVLDNLSTGFRDAIHPGARFVGGDVRDPSALAKAFDPKPDAVCHIAGQASVRLAHADPHADLGVNVGGTLNVLEHCLSHGTGRLIFASSMTVYGDPPLIPTPESAPVKPASFYGVTKSAAERYALLTGARTDLDTPLAVTSLRMFNVYGPRQSLANPYQGVLAIFLGNVMRGEPIRIHGDGEQSRDFVYISDVVRVWRQALDDPRAVGKVLNVGGGAPISVNRLCDAVLAQFGFSRASYRVDSAPAQQGDVRASAADISLIGETLGWKPRINFDRGLAETVAWARRTSAPAR
jgi:UDP-glucose 4-epimerase